MPTGTLFTTSISTSRLHSRIRAQHGPAPIRHSTKTFRTPRVRRVSGKFSARFRINRRDNLFRYGEDRWDAARIDREISTAAAWAARNRVPLTCNEFGAYRKVAPPADRALWIRDMRTALERYGIGWTMWDYAGGFAGVNKQNGHATPDWEIVKALGLATKKS